MRAYIPLIMFLIFAPFSSHAASQIPDRHCDPCRQAALQRTDAGNLGGRTPFALPGCCFGLQFLPGLSKTTPISELNIDVGSYSSIKQLEVYARYHQWVIKLFLWFKIDLRRKASIVSEIWREVWLFDFVSWIGVKCLWTEELWAVPVTLACGYGPFGVLCKVSGRGCLLAQPHSRWNHFPTGISRV